MCHDGHSWVPVQLWRQGWLPRLHWLKVRILPRNKQPPERICWLQAICPNPVKVYLRRPYMQGSTQILPLTPFIREPPIPNTPAMATRRLILWRKRYVRWREQNTEWHALVAWRLSARPCLPISNRIPGWCTTAVYMTGPSALSIRSWNPMALPAGWKNAQAGEEHAQIRGRDHGTH